MSEEEYSKNETWFHIHTVQKYMGEFVNKLLKRALVHDQSKLHSPEVEIFAKYTRVLKDLTYGTEEYTRNCRKLGPALQHHYSVNSHHPQHFENRIEGMDLLDLTEMICDWKAATERHSDGDIYRSLEINAKRFNMSPQLVNIFKNTIDRNFSV